MDSNNVQRNYYIAKTLQTLPLEIENGSLYYVKDTNNLYLDIDGQRKLINPTAEIQTALQSLAVSESELRSIRDSLGFGRYGVRGVGQEASALTRLYDSVGKVAQVGTDGDNSNVRNDFDNILPFARKKCVGHWEKGDGRAKFIVSAYLGDENYTEDGSLGDYVAVECPRCYYYFD